MLGAHVGGRSERSRRAASERLWSSQRHREKLNAPVIVAYGTLETPEFQRQSRDFAAAVKAAGRMIPVPPNNALAGHDKQAERCGALETPQEVRE